MMNRKMFRYVSNNLQYKTLISKAEPFNYDSRGDYQNKFSCYLKCNFLRCGAFSGQHLTFKLEIFQLNPLPAVGRAVNTGLLWLEDFVDMFLQCVYLRSQICKDADNFENLVLKMPSLSTLGTDISHQLQCVQEQHSIRWMCRRLSKLRQKFQKLLKNNRSQKNGSGC